MAFTKKSNLHYCHVDIFLDYANEVLEQFNEFSIVIDDSTDTLNKKIRKAEKLKFNFIFVLGEKEKNSNSINIRKKKEDIGIKSISDNACICREEANLMDIFNN